LIAASIADAPNTIGALKIVPRILDVIVSKDASRIRMGQSSQNMVVLHYLALNILNKISPWPLWNRSDFILH